MAIGRPLDWLKRANSLRVLALCAALVLASVLGNSPAVPQPAFSMFVVYYGPHISSVDERILEARPAYLVANTAHGLWAEVNGNTAGRPLEDAGVLQQAGIKVLSYLTSGYGGRGSAGSLDPQWYSLATIQRLLKSAAGQDQVDGVFVDECPAYPDGGQKDYYRQLTSMARCHGLTVWGNVGENDFDPWYFTDARFDFMNSSERWEGEELTPVQSQWRQRISIISLEAGHSLEEALGIFKEARRYGFACCCVTTSYLELPEWTEELAITLANKD